MSKAPPGPREIALRAMREAKYEQDQDRLRRLGTVAKAVKPKQKPIPKKA